MPFKSSAHKAKFEQLLAEKKITKEAFDRMAKGTEDQLPDRATPRKMPKKK